MLVKLQRNSYNGSDVPQILATTIVGILTGSITKPSDINQNHYSQSQCVFTKGSYDTPQYWSIAYSGANAVLSKPSSINNKINYFKLSYSSNYITAYTGNSLTGAVLSNQISAQLSLDITSFTSNKAIYLRFANNFIHLHINTNNSSYPGCSLVAFDFNENSYDSYSTEGSMKLLLLSSISNTMYISNLYSPATESYTPSDNINAPSNLTFSKFFSIRPSTDTSLSTSLPPLIPLIFNRLSSGWLGGNVSESTGLYATDNTLSPSDSYQIGVDNYLVVNNYTTYSGYPSLAAKI